MKAYTCARLLLGCSINKIIDRIVVCCEYKLFICSNIDDDATELTSRYALMIRQLQN